MTTWTNTSKNSSTFSNLSKNSSSWTNTSKTDAQEVIATAGDAMGLLLALTYSGGEILVAGGSITWTNQSKN